MTKDEAIRNQDLFKQVLGLERHPEYHNWCPFCEQPDSKTPSMSTYVKNGIHYFKCHSCEEQGDLISFVMKKQNCDFKTALEDLKLDHSHNGNGSGSYQPQYSNPYGKEPIKPVPRPEINGFADKAHKALIQSQDKLEFLYEKRMITPQTVEAYRLGIERTEYGAEGEILRCHWVLPICDEDNNLLAVKIHRENPKKPRPDKRDGTTRYIPKCQWLPFGTEPTDHPAHGFMTLWPPPEWFPPDEWIYLHGGELKALSAISGDLWSTSCTASESIRWPESFAKKFTGRKVCILYDDEPDKTNPKTQKTFNPGKRFATRAQAALQDHASELLCFTYSEVLKWVNGQGK